MKKLILFAFLTTFSSALFSQQASVASTEKQENTNLQVETRAERKERRELEKELENENKERARDLKKEMKARNKEAKSAQSGAGKQPVTHQRARPVRQVHQANRKH